MRRPVLRFLFIFLLLLLAGAVVVQVILWTSVPRQMVLGRLEEQLGLRVTAGSLSTNWLGHTTLKEVTLSLPLAEHALVEVPELRVWHTTLLGLLAGTKLDIDAIELRKPHLLVAQGGSGRWNVLEALELLARTGGKKKAETSERPKLPRLRVVDGQVTVRDIAHREAVIEPLQVEGYADSGVAWAMT